MLHVEYRDTSMNRNTLIRSFSSQGRAFQSHDWQCFVSVCITLLRNRRRSQHGRHERTTHTSNPPRLPPAPQELAREVTMATARNKRNRKSPYEPRGSCKTFWEVKQHLTELMSHSRNCLQEQWETCNAALHHAVPLDRRGATATPASRGNLNDLIISHKNQIYWTICCIVLKRYYFCPWVYLQRLHKATTSLCLTLWHILKTDWYNNAILILGNPGWHRNQQKQKQ